MGKWVITILFLNENGKAYSFPLNNIVKKIRCGTSCASTMFCCLSVMGPMKMYTENLLSELESATVNVVLSQFSG